MSSDTHNVPEGAESRISDVQRLCESLSEAFSPATGFQAEVKVSKADYGTWRYDLIYMGAFGRSDLNKIDEIARQSDCYYETGREGVYFTLSLPYGEDLQKAQEQME